MGDAMINTLLTEAAIGAWNRVVSHPDIKVTIKDKNSIQTFLNLYANEYVPNIQLKIDSKRLIIKEEWFSETEPSIKKKSQNTILFENLKLIEGTPMKEEVSKDIVRKYFPNFYKIKSLSLKKFRSTLFDRPSGKIALVSYNNCYIGYVNGTENFIPITNYSVDDVVSLSKFYTQKTKEMTDKYKNTCKTIYESFTIESNETMDGADDSKVTEKH